MDMKQLCRRIEEARWKGAFKTTWQLMDEQQQGKNAPAVAPANNNCTPERAPEAQKPPVTSTPKPVFGRHNSF